MQRPTTPVAATRQTRRWLPDAELDAHPLGTWLLQMGFDLWIRALYDREVLLPDDFRIAPGTLIASNHLRDVDGPLLGTLLVRRRGLRFQCPLPFFATREDLFRPGILARLTVHWPRPLPALLGHVSLAWFFPLGRAEPMRRVREFTLGETLHALLDAELRDSDCTALLNARGLRESGVGAGTRLRDVAALAPSGVLECAWGLRRLTQPARARIAPAFRTTVAAQLARFAQRLDRGRCVFFSPEGTISMDGHFSRIRAGFFQLTHMAAETPWIQPMAIGYDTLAPGRSRVVVRIGEAVRADTALDRRAFDAALRRAILALAPITPSHLLARWLLHGPAQFTQDDLADWLARGVATLRMTHSSLDPAFERESAVQLADRRLRWLERKNLVLRAGDVFRNRCERGAQPGWRTPSRVARYLDNQLSDLVPDADRRLPC